MVGQHVGYNTSEAGEPSGSAIQFGNQLHPPDRLVGGGARQVIREAMNITVRRVSKSLSEGGCGEVSWACWHERGEGR